MQFICRDHPATDSQGSFKKGNLQQAKGDHLDWVHSHQMVLETVRWGGWAAWAVAQSHHRTVRQQHWVLRNSSSGLSIYSSPLISAEMCWGDREKIVNAILIVSPNWVLSSRPDLHTAKQGLQTIHLICNWRRQIKPIFCISGITIAS